MCGVVRTAGAESGYSRQECQGRSEISSLGLGRWSGDTHTLFAISALWCHRTRRGSSVGTGQAVVYQSGASKKSCGPGLNLGPRWEVRTPQVRRQPRRRSYPGQPGKLTDTSKPPRHSRNPFLSLTALGISATLLFFFTFRPC